MNYETLLKCKCCYDNFSFVKKPLVLDCGHTICSFCCNNLITKKCCFCRQNINIKIINYILYEIIENNHNKILNKINNQITKELYEINNIVELIEKINPNKLFFIIAFLIKLDNSWLNKIYYNFRITENITFKECNLLSILLKYKKFNRISKFLINKFKIKILNSELWSELMISSRFSNYIMVKYLVEKGANLDVQDKDGWTALMLSSRYSNTDSSFETVKYLEDKMKNRN